MVDFVSKLVNLCLVPLYHSDNLLFFIPFFALFWCFVWSMIYRLSRRL